MSRPQADAAGDGDTLVGDLPICDYCGGYIVDQQQDCPALPDGVCYP